MPLSLAEISLEPLTIPHASPIALVHAAAEAGFGGVGVRLRMGAPAGGHQGPLAGVLSQLSASSVDVTDSEEAETYLTAVRSHELKVHCVQGARLDENLRPASLPPVFEFAARLGAKNYAVVNADSDAGRAMDTMGELAEIAGSFGLTLALEYARYMRSRTTLEAFDLVQRCGAGNVGLLVDALHFFRAGDQPAILKAIPAERIVFVELCDAVAMQLSDRELRQEAMGGRLDPGEGALDLQGLLAAMPSNVLVGIQSPKATGAPDPVARALEVAAAIQTFQLDEEPKPITASRPG